MAIITFTENTQQFFPGKDRTLVERYKAGQTYVLPIEVASLFISKGNARHATPSELKEFRDAEAAKLARAMSRLSA